MTRAEIRARLEDIAVCLEQQHAATVQNLLHAGHVDVYRVVTTHGESVVAPVLAALGNVYAALGNLEERS